MITKSLNPCSTGITFLTAKLTKEMMRIAVES